MTHIMTQNPSRILPGALHPQNKGACDWGWQSLLAYGCQSSVVIVDPKSVQILQVLRAHKSNVVKVKWCHENYYHDVSSPYKLCLATGDATGHVFVWDASQGTATMEFSDGTKPILDMDWVYTQGTSMNLLAVLHAPSSLILWNVVTGAQLWKKSFQENLICFAFDPFNSANVTLMSQEYILFVNDFSNHKAPVGNGRKFYMTSTASSNSGSNTPSSSSTSISSLRSTANSKSALKKVKLWAGDSKNRNDEENVPLSDCLELAYLPSCRHHVLLLFPRELLILDMEINQAVSSFILERNSPSFLSVIPTKQRDALMCLHENGMIGVRVRRRISQNPYLAPQSGYDSDSVSTPEIIYDSKCQSDPLRLSKSSRLFGFCCSPVNERNLALIVSDGRIMIWNLKPSHGSRGFEDLAIAAECPASLPLLPPSTIDTLPSVCLRLADMVPSPSVNSFQGSIPASFKFVMTGLLNSVSAPPTCASKCPPLTTRNWNTYKPLVAVGSTTGAIQVFNMKTGNLNKEYAVHACPVKGIAWIDLHSFLSWGHTTGNTIRNELQMLDLRTGHNTHLNLEKSAEDTPIECVKISSLKQYFLVIFKDRPMELWDLKSLSVIRRMPSTFLAVTAVEWTPLSMVKQRKRLSQQKSKDSSATLLDSPGHADSTAPQHFIKEEFVLAEVEGLIRELSVEGNGIKEHVKFPYDGNMGSINNILWKNSHMMVFSDANGTFCVLEIKSHLFVTRSTQRGSIKKMKFAPGKENGLVFFLFNDGFDIWDLHVMEKITSFKAGRDDAQVVDVDWLYSDMLIVAFSNGLLLATHTSLKDTPTAMADLEWEDPIWCPYLMSSKEAFVTKSLLQHQLWREEYNFKIDAYELPEVKDKKETEKQTQESGTDSSHEKESMILHQLSLLPKAVKDFLIHPPFGTAQRSLITAQLFGDESEMLFWTVVLHFLRREKARLACPQHKSSHLPPETSDSDLFNPAEVLNPLRKSGSTPSLDLLSIDDDLDIFLRDTPQEPLEPCTCLPISLDTCYDVLCDTEAFQKYQLDRLALHDSKRSSYNHTRKCAETLVLLGQADRAVQMYLETDPENENHYTDSLRACLVATIRSSGASQSTIKLVATNLIASGKLAEGVQLLCLINKGLDACRYLQTYSEWDQAAWLAKATLNYTDCAEVMRRWIEHLSSSDVNQQNYAVMVLLSLGQFHKALDMLYSLRHFNRAILFAEACQEFGFLSCEDEKTADLLPCVYVEYARYLFSLDMKKAAEFYIQKAGFKGKGHFEDPGIHL